MRLTVELQVAKSCKDKGAAAVDVITCDLSITERVDKMCKDLSAQHKGGLDVLVNNAASLGPIDYKKVATLLPVTLTCPGGHTGRCSS